MERLSSAFSGLDPSRRIFVALATVAVFAAVLMLARTANTPRMDLLYSGLDPAAAGEVISALEQQGATYQVRGSAIYVDSTQRDMLRMALAAEGKPATGSAGYEILDNLTGFGTTAQMFDAAFRRAIEGELSRTIAASPGIRSARVHIAAPDTRPFARDVSASASVVVTMDGGRLPPAQARALRFLVASAVDGLSPEGVTVIDSAGGIVGGVEDAAQGMAGTANDRAMAMRQNVERLLEARVGAGRAIVEVNVDTVLEREQIVERRFDPDGRVAISTMTEETTGSSRDARTGAVTAGGNLPDGDAGENGGESSSTDSGTREQINYEVSETQREVLRLPGDIRRLTVAVLVDGIRETQANGTTTWTPRPAEEIEALRELVASAVGFNEARGDQITLRSMEFPPVPADIGTEVPGPGLIQQLGIDVMRIVQMAVLAVVALVLGLFVVRPILTNAPAQIAAADDFVALPGASDDEDDGMPQMMTADFGGMNNALDMPMNDAMGAIEEDPGTRLQQLTDGRSSETAAVIQDWMEDEEAPA
ncbi:MAG: flagellar basal-body MS-ring/collar protein FliF [Pseudomonadota bacterium]